MDSLIIRSLTGNSQIDFSYRLTQLANDILPLAHTQVIYKVSLAPFAQLIVRQLVLFFPKRLPQIPQGNKVRVFVGELGMFFICLQGGTTALLALCLFNLILIYNFLHKGISWSPLLIAGCRLLLILLAACHAYTYSVGQEEAPASFFMSSDGGVATWAALALFAYVAGLGWLAKVESEPGLVRVWPCLLLALPIGLAVLMNSGEYRRDALMMSAILGLWVLRSLRTTFWVEEADIGRTVGGLLAGIVLVDLLAVALVPSGLAVVFIGLFALALAAQRLNVHRNTLSYRLQRIEALTGCSFDTPHDRLNISVALLIRRLSSPA